ncbi:MAG: helix-turn-helix domain-containing protein [Phycisphaeraceae bacterium]|nr:helix-turn-helix domain-containing protein [Phycisphaeraceae bacterium]
MTGTVAMRTIYFSPKAASGVDRPCCVMSVSPLLRELITHIVDLGALYEDNAAHLRLQGLLLDLLVAMPESPLTVPMPHDPRARRVADRVLAGPGARLPLARLAKGVGASPRTLERAFHTETLMTFGRWRHQVRLLEALRLLGDGMPVTSVAHRVGYASPSAFVAAFRRALGRSPARYFDPPDRQAKARVFPATPSIR